MWHYILDEEGNPEENAEFRIYLEDDPTTEANIFLTENASTFTTASEADLKTNADGFVDFWLGSEWEDGGYSHDVTFRYEWYKAGTAPGQIKDSNPWPNAFSWENTSQGADRDYRNKFISDFLGNKWWSHLQDIIPSASPHDLYPVDVTLGCDGQNRYNKVVSNKLLNDIFTWSESASAESYTHEGVFEYQEEITSWTVSGDSFYKDITHNLGNNYCTVQISNLESSNQLGLKKAIAISNNVTRIVMASAGDMRVNIQG